MTDDCCALILRRLEFHGLPAGAIGDPLLRAATMAHSEADCARGPLEWTHFLPLDDRFPVMCDRLFVALGLLPPAAADDIDFPVDLSAGRVTISLPESRERRRSIEKNRPAGFSVFDGVRLDPAWKGCAMSFRWLARRALDVGLERLTVMEDDALFPLDYDDAMAVVDRYLDRRAGEWDVFAGLITVVREGTEVTAMGIFEGIRFVRCNRLCGMVHNVYGRRALERLAAWDPAIRGDNQIDNHLNGLTGLRVVTTLPFLFDHCDAHRSTLWPDTKNRAFRGAIIRSPRRLAELAGKVEL